MRIASLLVATLTALTLNAQPTPDADGLWPDDQGAHINCHGGNILRDANGTYYWYGEHRVENLPGTTEDGIALYTSTDLRTWHNEGLVLRASADTLSDISLGCIMERPKVVHNARTGKYVMLFHHELRGKGYAAARVAFAVADSPCGPFTFIRSLRPNAGRWPADFKKADRKKALALKASDYSTWWTPEWREAIKDGLFLARDMKGGQMSRDMTVYVDDDGRAYHIFSSEDNLTLQVAELTKDYLDYTGRYWRIAPSGQNEAPTIFKKNGYYWLITSGCTGWAPNRARAFKAQHITGPWEQLDSPTRGEGADKTFGSQGTHIMPDPSRPGEFLFMADIWTPKRLSHSRHLWIPITFEDGQPVLRNDSTKQIEKQTNN